MTDYRALCAELHAAIQLYTGQNPAAAEIPSNQLVRRLMDAMAATATALAQPEPVGPTDEEEWYPGFADWLEREMPEGTVIGDPLWWASKIADYLARWGHPASQPEPVGPTDEELKAAYWEAFVEAAPCGADASWLAGLRAVASLAHPTPQPIPVAERLPGPGDCDAEGQIWAWYRDDPEDGPEGYFWAPLQLRLVAVSQNVTHWLPASALPIPRPPQPDPTA